MSDMAYQKFVKHWKLVTQLPPQKAGPLTPLYKALTRRLKVMPWPWLIVTSIAIVAGVFLLTRLTVTSVTSFLQRGF